MNNKYNFSITFWIKVERNPGWIDKDSEINFPPFTVKNGIKVFFKKQGMYMKIYLLHPEMGYRKLKVKIDKYITNDTFVALTNNDEVTKLYLNAELVKEVTKGDIKNDLEIGDYVMVALKNNDFKNINIDENSKFITSAKIKKILDDYLELEIFGIGPKIYIKELKKERLAI